MKELIYIIKKEDEGKTVEDILKFRFSISSRLMTKIKKCKDAILLNDIVVPIYDRVSYNDKLKVILDKTYDLEEYNQNKYVYSKCFDKLDVSYEDEYILCVNKKSKVATHPCSNHRENTLSDIVYTYLKEKYNDKFSLNLVNRLDKDTSGLVIFAKHPYAQEILSKQMQNGEMIKKYIAIVNGIIKEDEGIIEEKIARKDGSIIERCVSDDGDYAKTAYKVLKRDYDKDYTVVDVQLFTGRTHQIRVHFNYISHSLLGDYLYNKDKNCNKYINRLALHAYCLEFNNVNDGKKVTINIELDEEMKRLL